MCVVALKYFKEFGWVGVKNRDRNYKPTISIRQSFKDDVESIYIYDEVTKYAEGLNEYGLCILNTATSVKNDESVAALARRYEKKKKKSEGQYYSPDGVVFRKALKLKTPKEAINLLIENKIVGNTFVFNQEECYLLEGGREENDFLKNMEQTKEDPEHEWSKMKYDYEVKKIDKNETIIRTNHGHFLPWLGYQKDSEDEKQLLSRKSSESRYSIVSKGIDKVTTPDELLELVSSIKSDDSQMNPLRLGNYSKKTMLKTTGQVLLIPNRKRLIYRKIWCNMSINNFDKVNSHKTKTYADILSYNLPNALNTFKEHYYFNKD